MARSRRPPKAKEKLKAKESARREGVQTQAARAEVNSGVGDNAFGTGNSAMGAVKMASEEARMETCPECGYGGGRHAARICSKWVVP